MEEWEASRFPTEFENGKAIGRCQGLKLIVELTADEVEGSE